MKTILVCVLACTAAIGFTGCRTGPQPEPVFAPVPEFEPQAVAVTVTNELKKDLLQPAGGRFTLGPGDQLDIEILGDPLTRARVTVGPDGKIYYYLLPGTDVWGMTLAQVREKIEKGLGEFIGAPQVSVTLRAVGSKHIWLLGRLKRPGIYPVAGPTTLLESIAAAGGLATSTSTITTEELADLRRSFVMRDGKVLPVNFQRLLRQGDMSQNIFLEPDDFVFVPSALNQEIFVLGAVKSPRAIGYKDQMSLITAIANAQGTIKDAYLSHVAIVRGSLAEPQILVVDYKDIITGRSPDVRLEPRDIVYVPFSPYRTLTRYAELIVNTFVSTLAANEGARAVDENAQTIGVVSPVGN